MKKLLAATLAILALGAFATAPSVMADPADGKSVGGGTDNAGKGNNSAGGSDNSGSGNNSGDGAAGAPGQNK